MKPYSIIASGERDHRKGMGKKQPAVCSVRTKRTKQNNNAKQTSWSPYNTTVLQYGLSAVEERHGCVVFLGRKKQSRANKTPTQKQREFHDRLDLTHPDRGDFLHQHPDILKVQHRLLARDEQV